MGITNQVLNELTIQELTELNSNVIRILKSKRLSENSNLINNYNPGDKVVYIGKGNINGQEFIVKKIKKVNLLCENVITKDLWNLKPIGVKLVE